MKKWEWKYIVPLGVAAAFLLHGVFEGKDELLPTLALGLFAAVPFVELWIFRRRRRSIMQDPAAARGVQVATATLVWWNVALWLMPLVSILIWPGVNVVWMGLVALQPLYAYPLLLVAERIGIRRAPHTPRHPSAG